MATAKTGKVRRSTGLHHPVSVYAKQVTQGKLSGLCCEYEVRACQRHLDDLKRQGTKDFPYVFDTTRADRIIRWFGQCIQTRGVEAGQPIQLQPWQIFDLGCAYGWVDKDTGARRFSRTYNKRGRGNFKSTEKSGQALYHMCADALCQRRFEIVRKRRRNFVVFRRGVTKIKRFPAQKECSRFAASGA